MPVSQRKDQPSRVSATTSSVAVAVGVADRRSRLGPAAGELRPARGLEPAGPVGVHLVEAGADQHLALGARAADAGDGGLGDQLEVVGGAREAGHGLAGPGRAEAPRLHDVVERQVLVDGEQVRGAVHGQAGLEHLRVAGADHVADRGVVGEVQDRPVVDAVGRAVHVVGQGRAVGADQPGAARAVDRRRGGDRDLVHAVAVLVDDRGVVAGQDQRQEVAGGDADAHRPAVERVPVVVDAVDRVRAGRRGRAAGSSARAGRGSSWAGRRRSPRWSRSRPRRRGRRRARRSPAR